MTKFNLIFSLVAFLSVSTPVLADEQLRLSAIIVKPVLTAGKPYDVAFRYTGDPSSIYELCFIWSGEGPYCWSHFTVDEKTKSIRTKAITGNPRKYNLAGFIRYGRGQKTNRVSVPIDVRR